MRIAYVTVYNPGDLHAWSGSSHPIASALESVGIHSLYVGSLKERFKPLYLAKQLFYRGLGQVHKREREPEISRGYARQIERRLAAEPVDAVLSQGTIPIAYLRPGIPVAFWTDATFGAMIDYYPEFSGFSKETLRKGHQLEAAALRRSQIAIYTSQWAAKSACEIYGMDPAKVHVVPFGANVVDPPDGASVARAVRARAPHRCELLFAGMHWERKGGAIAMAAAARMNRDGMPTILHVLGCRPPGEVPPYVKVHGFVSKRAAAGNRAVAELFARAHLLILPTRAECVANVFAEACCHGLPILSTDTGGVATAVIDGRNGKLLPLEAGGDDFAAAAMAILSDPDVYASLAANARAEYESTLNWQVAVSRVRQLLATVCEGCAA
jgi:glycosyltransferase involved in cell wall biosynthesis